MGDSSAMTIEFLRARLLAERSVSRSARQRADQLAKRVVELEEQLRIVTIQRKKAEKAAVEVLSILETQGIGDFSEVIDSSSDQDEVPGRLKETDDTVKDGETSTASRMDRSEVDDGFSGSELEVSPSQGQSLSWKSRSTSPDSHEKTIVNQTRQRQRRSSFGSTVGSSPRHNLGKSCRKIRRRETGYVAEDGREKSVILDVHGRKEATQCTDVSNCSCDLPEMSKENKAEKPEGLVPCILEGQSQKDNVDLYANGSDRDEEMERALEHQAQLIGQYEAEENAQREWEEKYNEHNSSTLLQHSYELGRGTDITEDTNVPMEKSTKLASKVLCYDKEAKLRAETIGGNNEAMTRSLSDAFVPSDQTFHRTVPESSGSSKEAPAFLNGFVAADISANCSKQIFPVETGGLTSQQCNIITVNESKASFQEFEFPGQVSSDTKTNGKQDLGLLDDNCSSSNPSLQPCVHGFLEKPSMEETSSAQSSDKFSKGKWSEIQNQLHRVLPQTPNRGVGGVLEALQHAKLSLTQELNRLPLARKGSWATTTDSQVLAIKSSDTLDIPVGCAGLFRLPTDASPQTDFSRHNYRNDASPQADFSRHNYHNSGLSLTNHRFDVAASMISSGNSHFSTNPFLESGSRHSFGRQYFDPYLNLGTEMPSRYSYPLTDISARTASNDRLPKPYTDTISEMPAADRYSMYGVDWIQRDKGKM